MSCDLAAIEQAIQDLLQKTLAGSSPLTRSTRLVDDLNLESVQVMEIIVELEDFYDIAIDLESLSHVDTIGDLAAVVAQGLQ